MHGTHWVEWSHSHQIPSPFSWIAADISSRITLNPWRNQNTKNRLPGLQFSCSLPPMGICEFSVHVLDPSKMKMHFIYQRHVLFSIQNSTHQIHSDYVARHQTHLPPLPPKWKSRTSWIAYHLTTALSMRSILLLFWSPSWLSNESDIIFAGKVFAAQPACVELEDAKLQTPHRRKFLERMDTPSSSELKPKMDLFSHSMPFRAR